MTSDKLRQVSALSKTEFTEAFDHRLTRHLERQAKWYPDKPLTRKQAQLLGEMVHRYRRQHRQCRCEECRKK